ncbi:hypothetical protein TNCV_3808761 [Trichonephila clavipes]|nr:hypothetical protein TNCV_3808761 [Trichonephila clavipes]
MSARHHLSDYDRGRAVGRLKAIQSVTSVAAAMVLVAKRNRNFTPGRIASSLETATGTQVSARTISRRLNQVGLFVRKPVRCIPLQRRHRREITHTVTSDSGHQLLSKERGTRYAQKFICERDWYGGVGRYHMIAIAEHSFTSLSEEALHRNGIEE